MTETEISRIKIDDFEVGIVGLKKALSEVLSGGSEMDDITVEALLIEKLSDKNYIPSSARQKYGTAFLREFKKFRGDKLEEETTEVLDIKVLGPGCFQCETLEKTVMKVLSQMSLPASVEHIKDIKEIASFGLFSTPALMINGTVVSTGSNISEKKLQDLINKFSR